MKKILIYMFLIMFLVIMIPVAVLGGVGPGINIPGIISRLPFTESRETLAGGNGAEKVENVESLKLKVYVTEDKKIEEMDIEEYVKGVVAAEMPAAFDLEALKAQAVAARTYAAAKNAEFGGEGCSKHPGADVCTDIHCQDWMSKEERFKNWRADQAVELWNKISQAVDETKGMVITYSDDIAKSIMYHSTSGGKTESCTSAYGYSVPYLVSVDSPGEEEAPSYQSTETLKIDEFIKRVKALDPSVKISSKSLSSQVKTLELTDGGRVKTIKIGDKTFGGVEIRWAMGLKSANFTVKVDSKNVIFNVRGYGHGVGMSQWGAGEMAKKGSKYDDILKHYYQGIEIKKINEINKYKNTNN